MSKRFFHIGLALLICSFGLAALADEIPGQIRVSTYESDLSRPAEVGKLPVKYVGNNESRKFHRPSCPFARVMSYRKRVQFYFRRQAVACGHKPCRYCLPQIWTVCRAKILTPLKGGKDELPHPHAYPP